MLFRVYSGVLSLFFFFFFNDTATTEIYTLSLHDALPICEIVRAKREEVRLARDLVRGDRRARQLDHSPDEIGKLRLVAAHGDRKSTRLNSSHLVISYAVFCLKKKKKTIKPNKHNHTSWMS